MSSHLNRKDLKHDVLADEVNQGVHYVATHKSQVTRYATIALGLLVVLGGYWIYTNRQAAARQDALREARAVLTATVGAPAIPPNKSFATKEEQAKAVTESFTKLGDQYPGSTEGSIARMYLASQALDRGEIDKSVALYRQVAADAPAEFESSAKLALAQVIWGQGKTDEAKKLLEELIAKPTAFVSAEQAKLTLARLQLDSAPDEARKLLEELRNSTSTISTMAVEMMGQLPSKAN